MTVGQRIQTRRKQMNLSVDELAERIGKNRATVYRYESEDIKNLPVGVLEDIARALRITPGELLAKDISASGDGSENYYLDPEAAKIAQQVFEDPDLRLLFEAAQNVKPENIRLAAEMLRRFKEDND